ncbi:hypothetical protein [Pantoea agglomerans]|uniref:hypothetical protein n=1 Tax=Enterobacter agglomerans TaxID=549 RepID=UPI00320AC905
MAKIVSATESRRKKIQFACDGELKDEYDSLRKELNELGLKINLNEDFEKVVRGAIAEMKKAIAAKLNLSEPAKSVAAD